MAKGILNSHSFQFILIHPHGHTPQFVLADFHGHSHLGIDGGALACSSVAIVGDDVLAPHGLRLTLGLREHLDQLEVGQAVALGHQGLEVGLGQDSVD